MNFLNFLNVTTSDIPLSIDTRMKWFVNNPRFADVTFVVGEKKEIIYAHKCIIASGQCHPVIFF